MAVAVETEVAVETGVEMEVVELIDTCHTLRCISMMFQSDNSYWLRPLNQVTLDVEYCKIVGLPMHLYQGMQNSTRRNNRLDKQYDNNDMSKIWDSSYCRCSRPNSHSSQDIHKMHIC